MESFVSAIVLAAGMSKRMGALKQLIKVGDRTLLEKTLSSVGQSRAGETILVLGHRSEEIRQAIQIDPATKIVLNDQYENGMSTSIQAGLRNVSPATSAALIVLADQPYLMPDVIDQLIEEREKSGASILFPVYKGFRGNPVLIDRSLFPELMQISGDIGCRSLFGLHSTKIGKVIVEDAGILIDIDTQEDLAKIASPANHYQAEQQKDRFVGSQKHLVVIGQSDVADMLIRFGKLLDFYVTAIAPLTTPEAHQVLNELDLGKANVTSNSYIVVASRGKFDEEALEQAVRSPASYIALVGSKKRGAEIMATNKAFQRVRYPAGLEIHASTPAEIALSVLAEIVSLQGGKT